MTTPENPTPEELLQAKSQIRAWLYQLLAAIETEDFVSGVRNIGSDDQLIIAVDFRKSVQSIADFGAFKKGV